MKKKFVLWIPVIAWMILIFCFSAQNADESDKTSGIAAKIFEYLINTIFGSSSDSFKSTLLNNCHFIVRKTAHFTEYTILGILSSIAFKSCDKLSAWLKKIFPAALCLLYAASDELHQAFVPGRSCQFRDVMIDFSGAVFGILIFSLFVFKKTKAKSQTEI